MTIDRISENGKEILKLEGWLDTTTSEELGKVVDGIESFTSLVLDFDKLEYISSAGIRQVAACSKKAKALNADFSIINACFEVMSIFKLTQLDKKFDISIKN